MECSRCGKHVRLIDNDAGSETEIYRTCDNCLKSMADDTMLGEVAQEIVPLLTALKKLDCGSHSCRYAQNKNGQRTNKGCTCLRSLPTGVRIGIEKVWHYFS